MKKILVAVLFVQSVMLLSCAEKKIENWKTKLDGAIFSTPTILNNTIYIGTENGFFYKIDAANGKVLCQLKLSSPIRSNALVFEGKIYIESLGQLYCLDEISLKELFRISPPDENLDMVDPWDYFHSSPILHDGNIFYAANKGKIYVINPKDGSINRTISTPEGAPIRSELTFNDDKLYFGDINGVVYEYNFTSESFTLIHHIYSKRLYSTFGFITGKPIVDNGNLFFSNRNESFTVLDLKTQAISWSYNEPGYWWPASPIIVNNKVIIGGSDNTYLVALSLDSGKVFWRDTVDHNNFCKPLIIDNTIIMGTGDSYLNRKGKGSVYSINAENGKLINKYRPSGNVFSSPTKYIDNTIICTTTGNIISIKNSFFTNPAKSKVSLEGDCNIVFESNGSSIQEKKLNIITSGEAANLLSCSVKTDGNFPDSLIKVKGERDWVYATDPREIYFQVNRGAMKSRKYAGKLTIKVNNGQQIITKPFSISIEGNKKTNEPSFEVQNLQGDSKDGSVNFKFQVNRKTTITTRFVYADRDSLAGFLIQEVSPKWGIYRFEKDIFSNDFNRLPSGKYRILFEGNGEKQQFDFTKE